jgi:hypothetical protein
VPALSAFNVLLQDLTLCHQYQIGGEIPGLTELLSKLWHRECPLCVHSQDKIKYYWIQKWTVLPASVIAFFIPRVKRAPIGCSMRTSS